MTPYGKYVGLNQEETNQQKLGALPLLFLGTVALVWKEVSVDKNCALILSFCAVLFYSFYILLSSRLLRKMPPDISVPYVQRFAAMVLSLIFLHDSHRALAIMRDAWLIVILIAFPA
jgi:drug/metabolite transporter (DMT)-like permease